LEKHAHAVNGHILTPLFACKYFTTKLAIMVFFTNRWDSGLVRSMQIMCVCVGRDGCCSKALKIYGLNETLENLGSKINQAIILGV
jgi:hypothetical protein